MQTNGTKILMFVLTYIWVIVKYFLTWTIVLGSILTMAYLFHNYPKATFGVIALIVVFVLIPWIHWPEGSRGD